MIGSLFALAFATCLQAPLLGLAGCSKGVERRRPPDYAESELGDKKAPTHLIRAMSISPGNPRMNLQPEMDFRWARQMRDGQNIAKESSYFAYFLRLASPRANFAKD